MTAQAGKLRILVALDLPRGEFHPKFGSLPRLVGSFMWGDNHGRSECVRRQLRTRR
ncbi:protein of unknown function [Hyphomicrobium sp. MC1]|nr:protein of unknown function [Hyphomicrobium sp. MC1]